MKKTKIPTVYTYYLYYRFPGMKAGVYDAYVTYNEDAAPRSTSGVFLPGTEFIDDEGLLEGLSEPPHQCHTCSVVP